MEVIIHIPHPALQEFVINISTVSALLPDGIQEVVTPYPPTPFQSILFYCNNPISMREPGKQDFNGQPDVVLLGSQFSRVSIKVHQQLRAIRVDFYPGAVFRLLGIPMHEMLDRGFDALDFFGAEIREVNEKLKNLEDLDDGKDVVEQFLLKKAETLKEILPFDKALKQLLNHSGNLTVEKTASHACLSLKQFERKCIERIGLPPKTYARILRFSKAYRLHESLPQLSWTAIAHTAGYYDQMHMIRDFRVFAGVNPTAIEQELRHTPLRMQKDLPA